MILTGDSKEVLATLDTASVDMCITSPPYYGLRDYGTADWEGGDSECDHIDPDGATHGKTAQVGAQKNDYARKQYKVECKKCGAKRVDKQLGMEPSVDEYIGSLCEVFDEVARVLKPEGTCWVNLGDSYGKDKGLVCVPWMFALEMINRGWILRNTIIWHKPSCMPSSVKDRFTVDFEYLFFFARQQKYYFEQQLEPAKEYKVPDKPQKLEGVSNGGDSVWKGINSGRGRAHFAALYNKDEDGRPMRNKRTVWSINTARCKEAHFAVFPEELIKTPIKAGCPEGGIVLDPFFGAGTTGIVATKQGKKYIGIELNPDYVEIAKARIEHYKYKYPLLS